LAPIIGQSIIGAPLIMFSTSRRRHLEMKNPAAQSTVLILRHFATSFPSLFTNTTVSFKQLYHVNTSNDRSTAYYCEAYSMENIN